MVRVRTLLRIILYGVIAWFFLASVYFALPSPGFNEENATKVLAEGGTLTRAYSSSFYSGDQDGFVLMYRIDHNRIDHNRTNTTLEISTLYNLVGDAREAVIRLPLEEDDSIPQLTTFLLRVAEGVADGLSPPWFAFADAILLRWELIPRNYLSSFIVQWSKKNFEHDTLEIFSQHTAVRQDWSNTTKVAAVNTKKYRGTPLIRLTFHMCVDPLWGAKKVSRCVQNVELPARPQSAGPSWTLGLRRAILSLLATPWWTLVKMGDALGMSVAGVLQMLKIMLVGILSVAACSYVKKETQRRRQNILFDIESVPDQRTKRRWSQ